MVNIVRRKDARIAAPDVSSSQLALASGLEKIGNQLLQGGEKLEKQGIKERKQAETSYIQDVADNLRTEQKRLADQQKTFDAADKLVAADMSGRLRNDLLRWNMEQREKNPSAIGTPEHERAMRDMYARLSKQYGAGLGEVGTAAFNEKTQATVNDFIQNDIKWSYQKKIKQAEQAARDAAKAAEQTAAAYGANGDVDGFKQAHSENRQALEEYANDVAPAGANQALAELDKNALLQFYNNLAQTNPVMAKALLDSMENFKETVPDEMLQNANESAKNAQAAALKDEIIMLNAAIENAPKGSTQEREAKKAKKQLEKALKDIEKEDLTDKSLESMRKDVKDAVEPVLKKSLGESALMAKKEHEAQKVRRFQDFLKLPTPENLKWFEEDNQMSYAPKDTGNMSELPEDMKSKQQRNNELLDNMIKYRENFGNVSMREISDYSGTQQTFDALKALAKVDADADGNTDNVLLQALETLNSAKGDAISQSDYNNLEKGVNRILFDRTGKEQMEQFIDNTKNFAPKHFWDSPSLTGSNRTRIMEQFESRQRDVLRGVVAAYADGADSQTLTQMYIDGVKSAYNATVDSFFNINMAQIEKDYAEKGYATARIRGIDYLYKGTDSTGNPQWQSITDESAKALAKVAPKIKTGSIF